MEQSNLKEIVEKLIALGEDKDELMYWVEIFDDLPAEKQSELLENLKKELETLTKSK